MENAEIKKIREKLESMINFIMAQTQLSKQTHLIFQEVLRELRSINSILKGVAEDGISIPIAKDVSISLDSA